MQVIGLKSDNPTRHEEIAGAADDRQIPRFLEQWIAADDVESPFIVGGVEHQSVSKPCTIIILLVVEVEPLSSRHRRREEPAVLRQRVVEHHHHAEVEVADARVVGDLHGGGVGGVGAVEEDVVIVKHDSCAWFVFVKRVSSVG